MVSGLIAGFNLCVFHHFLLVLEVAVVCESVISGPLYCYSWLNMTLISICPRPLCHWCFNDETGNNQSKLWIDFYQLHAVCGDCCVDGFYI